jgi:hypothetical protein
MAIRLALTLSLLITLTFSAAEHCHHCLADVEQNCIHAEDTCDAHDCDTVIQHTHQVLKQSTAIYAKPTNPLKHISAAPVKLSVFAVLTRLPNVASPPSHSCCSPFTFNNSILRC